MSRSAPPLVTNTPVLSGTQLTQSLYTTSGFAVGDYVYQYTDSTSGYAVGYPFTAIDSTSISLGSSWVYPNRLGTYTQYTSYSTSTYKAALSSPAIASIAYTGLSLQGSNAFSNVFATMPSSNIAVASCINAAGNYVITHYNGANLYFSTYNTATAAVVTGPTLITSTLYTTGGTKVSVAPMTDGGWIVAAVVTGTLLWTYYRYNSSGTQTATGTIDTTAWLTSGDSNEAGYQIFGFSNGSWFFGWQQWASPINFRGMVFSAANALVGTRFVDPSVISAAGGSNGGIQLASNGTTILVVQVLGPTSGGSASFWSYAFTSASSTPTSSGAYSPPTGYGTFGFMYSQSLVSTTGNTFSLLYVSTSNTVGVVLFTSSGAINTSAAISPTITVSLSTACGGYALADVSSRVGFFVTKSDGAPYYVVISGNTVVSTTPVTSGFAGFKALANSCQNKNTYTVSNQNYQVLCTPYTSGVYLLSPYNYTKNSTQFFDTSTTRLWNPGTGYYFLGIGAATAAAGSFGTIIVNGSAQLNSGYSSTAVNNTFDYTTPIIKGNRGTQTGLNVNLKGFE